MKYLLFESQPEWTILEAIFYLFNFWERDWERVCACVWGGAEGGELLSRLHAGQGCPTQASIGLDRSHRPWDHDLSQTKSRTLNGRSHPGAPRETESISDILPLWSICSNATRGSAPTKVHWAATRQFSRRKKKITTKKKIWEVNLTSLTLYSYNQTVYFSEQANYFKGGPFTPGSLHYWI